jgi:hypothetical protein
MTICLDSLSFFNEQVLLAAGAQWDRATEYGRDGRVRARLAGTGGIANAVQPAGHPTAHRRWKWGPSSLEATRAPGNRLRRRKGPDDPSAQADPVRGQSRDRSDRVTSDRQGDHARSVSARGDCSRLELPRARPRSEPQPKAMPRRLNQPIPNGTNASSRLVAQTNENVIGIVTLPRDGYRLVRNRD